MRRPKPTYTVRCATAGCGESSIYEFDSQREKSKSEVVGKPWFCVRHSMPDRVLSPERLRVEWMSEPNEQRDYGRFFGSSGLIVNTAFYAAAKDFPIGTRVRVTCEVLLPESGT